MSGQNNGLTPNDIFSSKVEKFNDNIKMIYYRTSNNNNATAEAMEVVFRKHLLAQTMPKNQAILIRNSM